MKRVLAAAMMLAGAMPVAAAPAMWRVADADTEIVLFGSIHALPPGIPWLTPRIAARVDAADTLVLEAVIPADPAVIGRLAARLGYTAGLPPLSARVAPSRRARLQQAAASVGVAMASLDAMESWLAAIALGEATLTRLGYSAQNGVEAMLSARARAAGRPVAPLETLEQQLGYFDALPENDQRALLDATVDDTATAATDMQRLTTAWLAGDTGIIADAYGKDAFGATPVLARVLIQERNARWADWIRARMAVPGKVFVAVGAAHLAGPDSVQAMLARRGVAAAPLP